MKQTTERKLNTVDWWRDPPLVASKFGVGLCCDVGGEPRIGFDMMADDGNTFGHAHVTLEAAIQFHRNLGLVIEEAKKEAGLVPQEQKN